MPGMHALLYQELFTSEFYNHAGNAKGQRRNNNCQVHRIFKASKENIKQSQMNSNHHAVHLAFLLIRYCLSIPLAV